MIASSLLIDEDRAWLVSLRTRNEECQYAVAVFGLDALSIDLHRHRERPVERSDEALSPVDTDSIRVGDALLAGNTDGVVLGLNFEVSLVDAGHLENGDQIIALLE